MSKKFLITALAGVAAVTLSSTVLADYNSSNSDVYVGIQAGYGDTHTDDIDFTQNNSFPIILPNGDPGVASLNLTQSGKGTGFAGRLFAGYDYNQYLGVETGFTYFPKSTVKLNSNASIVDTATGLATLETNSSETTNFSTYGVDLLGKVSVPVVDNFGLYAKAGPGYLHSGNSGTLKGGTNNVDLVYGLGADYAITPHLVADVSFTRFNGNHKQSDDKYQPNADLYALGLSYKFNV